MRAAVLGYGPAGLIAAKTLADLDIPVEVIGAGGKSVVGGAQYLHEDIFHPAYSDPEGFIEFLKMGERDVYAGKIYPQVETSVSWDNYEGAHAAWSLRPVYDQLWGVFEDLLVHDTLDGMSLAMLAETDRYDIIFNSIPAQAVCLDGMHGFPRVPISLVNYSPIAVPNVVLYSGRSSDQWYRTSRIFGEGWTEFGGNFKAEYDNIMLDPEEEGNDLKIHRGFKPLGTNCDCHPDVVRIGRFGLWDRKVLLHHVPDQVRAALTERSAA